jgi:hypothetical protein
MNVILAGNLGEFIFKYSLLQLFICCLQMNSKFKSHFFINKENVKILCVDTFDCSGQ